ncbi:GNAT family N-acetyltransferase [Phaeacidiphilus oryzae]|uniref:GNAT family N-acetyltransferase n=1 Tax=Phaeacidiphilus oryzae TaxID=348818 RepID=UPI00056C26E5|nr:GNAT family N-acetyltransferase [Phaeacidiphilus oryzae]
MAWEILEDAERFRGAAAGYLHARPALCTLLLTVSEAVRGNGGANPWGPRPAWFGVYRDGGGRVLGGALRTPPHGVVLGPGPAEAAAELAGLRPCDTVTGAPELAAAYAEARGGEWRVRQEQRLYRLGELTPQRPAPKGSARLAAEADAPLLARWAAEFTAEAHGGDPLADPEGWAGRRIGSGLLTVWQVDGEPVCFAGRSQVVAGQARIAPVYTPAGLRGRGYAGAATAAASRSALDAGAEEVLLFTDLANPTSNALYQRLGYRPIADQRRLVRRGN